MRIIEQDPSTRAIEIVELTRLERPQKGKQAAKTERQRHGNQQEKPSHACLRAIRIALPTTMSDEVDIAIAARSGVAAPAIANGSASAL